MAATVCTKYSPSLFYFLYEWDAIWKYTVLNQLQWYASNNMLRHTCTAIIKKNGGQWVHWLVVKCYKQNFYFTLQLFYAILKTENACKKIYIAYISTDYFCCLELLLMNLAADSMLARGRTQMEQKSQTKFLPWLGFEPQTSWLAVQHANH